MRYGFSVAPTDALDAEIFYVWERGWSSKALGYHAGVGPYFSLPEAIRRVEAKIGETAWRPHVVTQEDVSCRSLVDENATY